MIPLVLALTALAPATPTAAVPINSYRVVVRSTGGETETRTVVSPDRWRVRQTDASLGIRVGRDGDEFLGREAGLSGSILRNLFAAQPDGFPGTGDRYSGIVSYALGQARSGVPVFTEVNLGGRAALRARIPVPANDCAGLPPRTVTIWLAKRTLLLRRAEERQQSNNRLMFFSTYTYTALNGSFPAATFNRPPLGPRPFVINNRFTRTAPAHAAGPLPYTPRLPQTLPDGFALDVSGWAPRSNNVGPEGSVAPMPWLFSATYRRGQEQIDVTQRVSRSDWPDDPFGAECSPLRTEPVTLGTVPATFGTGETIGPHVYWRDGNLLYTVSGPFSKADLVAIASSLTKIGA